MADLGEGQSRVPSGGCHGAGLRWIINKMARVGNTTGVQHHCIPSPIRRSLVMWAVMI